MEKLNIAELLKDCPKGMELDCTMWDNLYFDRVENDLIHCYYELDGYRNTTFFCKNGCYTAHKVSKCVIFPKGKTTWEGFQRPFKDGDVVTDIEGAIIIYKGITTSGYCGSFVSLDRNNQFIPHCISYLNYIRFATEEEKQKLFDAIKANGYKWNPETKTLEKLIEPKFKVGDRVLWKYDTETPRTIFEVKLTSKGGYVYWINCEGCPSRWWNETELIPIPNKFDITTLKPFDKVLVRDTNGHCWRATFYSHRTDTYSYTTTGLYAQCIPFEDNKHLLGTTNDCDEYYKTWE